MTMAQSALARDLEDLQERLQVAPPPRVARRVRALIGRSNALAAPLGCGSDQTQNIQYGAARASRLADQVAAHGGGSWPPLELTAGDFSRSART